MAVDEAVRLHFRKLGFEWAIVSAQARIDLPTFDARIREGVTMVLQAIDEVTA